MSLFTKLREAFGARCKPNDLAFHVGVEDQFQGRITRVVKAVKTPASLRSGRIPVGGRWWLVDPPLGGVAKECADVALRPIRAGGLRKEDIEDLYRSAPTKQTEAA